MFWAPEVHRECCQDEVVKLSLHSGFLAVFAAFLRPTSAIPQAVGTIKREASQLLDNYDFVVAEGGPVA